MLRYVFTGYKQTWFKIFDSRYSAVVAPREQLETIKSFQDIFSPFLTAMDSKDFIEISPSMFFDERCRVAKF